MSMAGINTDNDVQAWEWIDGDGGVHAFDLANGIIPGTSTGTGIPPTRRTDLRVPGRPGSFTLDRSYGERTWTLQVGFVGADVDTLEDVLADWATRFNVLRGGGQMRRTRNDGVTRRVQFCDYDDGFAIDQDTGVWDAGVQPASLVFFAADPFWYDAADTVLDLIANVGLSFFPIPNPRTGSFITLTPIAAFASATIDNDGDVAAYPVWTITGPGSGIVLRNLTTGQVLDLSAAGGLTLASTDVLTIDTRPGESLVQLASGTLVARYMTDASEMWPLALGTNQVQVSMVTTDPGSSVTLTYRLGHLTP